jgi:hypothetical protein
MFRITSYLRPLVLLMRAVLAASVMAVVLASPAWAADPLPALSINDTTVIEGDSGTSNATFTVSLAEPSSLPVSMNYATADDTATAGEDYVAENSGIILTFEPGETSKTLTVAVNGDTLHEPDETFFMNLSNVVNATISDSGSQGTGTITSDDPPPDMTAPTVTTTTPQADAMEVSRTTTVTANFSEAVQGVDPTTFKLEQVTVKRGVERSLPVNATVTPSADSKTAVLDPTKNLVSKGIYRATLTDGVTDKAGNALAPKTWSFTVANR